MFPCCATCMHLYILQMQHQHIAAHRCTAQYIFLQNNLAGALLYLHQPHLHMYNGGNSWAFSTHHHHQDASQFILGSSSSSSSDAAFTEDDVRMRRHTAAAAAAAARGRVAAATFAQQHPQQQQCHDTEESDEWVPIPSPSFAAAAGAVDFTLASTYIPGLFFFCFR